MIYSIDTETYDRDENGYLIPVRNTQKYILGGLYFISKYGKETYFEYKNKEDLKDKIKELNAEAKKNEKRAYIYAHKAEYDYYCIYGKEILNHKILRNDPLISYIDSHTQILDTMSFYRCSLAEVGIKLGIPKLEMPRKIEKIEELSIYLKRDCEITLKAMIKLRTDLRNIGINPKRMITAGQIAMNAYSAYLSKKLYHNTIMKNGHFYHSKYPNMIRKAYKIGRNTCFQKGIFENVSIIDCNSLFPYAMTEMEIPNFTQEFHCMKPLDIIDKNKLLNNYTGVISCTLNLNKYKGIGYLPIRYNKYIIFPKYNIIQGTFTIPEVRKAVELGYEIEDIKEATFYRKGKINPFKEYINEMYNKRLNNPELAETIKILMNYIHGKMARKSEKTDKIIGKREDINKRLQEGYKIYGEIDHEIIFGKTIELPPTWCSNIMLSTLIVSKAREIMYDHYIKVPEEEILYTDTDSIIMPTNYINKFKISKKLGEFKIVDENINIELIKNKAYIKNNNKVVLSGKTKEGLSAELLRNGLMKNHMMIGLPQALQMNRIDLLGTFIEKDFSINESKYLEDYEQKLMPIMTETNYND